MGVNYTSYGSINIDGIELIRDNYNEADCMTDYKDAMVIIGLIVDNSRFSLDNHGDIIYSYGYPNDLEKDFITLIEEIYNAVEKAGFNMEEFVMFGKIIIDYTDYNEATDVMILATDNRKVTIYP